MVAAAAYTALEEDIAASFLGHDPIIASSFHTASQGGVARRQEYPAFAMTGVTRLRLGDRSGSR
jgi:hypothetical protein